jgi:hypothetical protein
MALTPTNLIAVTGIMSGDGFGINTDMTSAISRLNSNPMISGFLALIPYTSGANAVPGLSDTLASLPPFLVNSSTTGASVLTQAQGILPGAGTLMGNKNFLDTFGSASVFGSAAAEYSAALQQFNGKSFGDLGVGVNNYTGMLTGGTGAIMPSLQRGILGVAAAAKASTLGTVSPATALAAVNPSAAASSFVGDGLKSVGSSLKNFGTLFDFKNLGKIASSRSMVAGLQDKGLADRYGINDSISAQGYDPKDLNSVPESVLTASLAQVQGDDLKKIQEATGVKLVQSVQNLSQLLQVEKFLPPQALAAMGIANAGAAGLGQLGNTLINLGVQADNFKMGDFIGGIETKSLQYLESLTALIPTDVRTALLPFLGTGSGPFGNPTMGDMIGSAAGITHTDAFNSINTSVAAIQNSSYGQAVQAKTTALNAAIAASGSPGTDPAVATAKSELDTAIAALNSQALVNSSLKSAYDVGNQATAGALSKLSTEASNLLLAGKTLTTSVVNLGNSVMPFLSFGSSLATMGVDTLQVGYNKVLAGTATASLTGDAIQASLMEGRNIARSSKVGKPVASQANTTQALADANTSQLPVLQAATAAAQAAVDQATQRGDVTAIQTAVTNLTSAQQALADARRATGDSLA